MTTDKSVSRVSRVSCAFMSLVVGILCAMPFAAMAQTASDPLPYIYNGAAESGTPIGWTYSSFSRQSSGGVDDSACLLARLISYNTTASVTTSYVAMGANPVVSFKYKTTSYDWDETTASANAVKYILEVTKDDGATWTTVIPEAANVSSADFVKATVGLPASYANQIAMARITFRLVAGDIMVRLDDVDMGSGYRVTFDANGGAATTASDMTGTDSKLSSLPTPTRTGYTFNGWFTEKTGGTQVSTNTVFSADATIYARWTPITYTITYILAGGAVEPANPTNYTAETTTFTLNNPTRTDYTFAGWTGANGATPQATVSVAQGSAGDKSYTANWSTVSV